jgi:hypothetical protein
MDFIEIGSRARNWIQRDPITVKLSYFVYVICNRQFHEYVGIWLAQWTLPLHENMSHEIS